MAQAEDGGTLAGRSFGAYRLRERLHEGAAAELYRADDAQLGRAVVVKVLNAGADEAAAERFAAAARLMASLDHGNVVRVLAYGEVEGRHYLAMPQLKETLRERMAREGIPPVGETARIVAQVAAGLYAAHTHGFAHGNLTPDHVLFDETGRVLLTDFAAPTGAGEGKGGVAGARVGTDAAPGERPDRASRAEIAEDVYALGAVLYELLAGVPPVWRIGDDEASSGLVPPSARNPLIWPELDAVVAQALAADPDARYVDTRLFAQALRATVLVHLHGQRISAEHPVPEIRAPKASFDAPGALLPSTEEMKALRGARRMDRRVLIATAALAAVLVLACVGSAFAVVGGFHFGGGSGPNAQGPDGGGADRGGQLAVVTATATYTPLVTPTPIVTATSSVPTATPGSQPTATPPRASLTFSPTQVHLSGSSGNCMGSQTIYNNASYKVSWAWSSGGLPPGFKWEVDSPPTQVGYPSGGPMRGQTSVTLFMSAWCNSHNKTTYPITVRDSEGFTYSISLVA